MVSTLYQVFCKFPLIDGCPSTVTIIPSISGDKNLDITITWPETNIGVNAIVDCPCGSNNSSIGGHKIQASRYCGGDFTYGGVCLFGMNLM